jgi:hypothetical protein
VPSPLPSSTATALSPRFATARSVRPSPLNADFHGPENNQPFWGRKPRFLGDFAISALGSLIVYLAENDSIGIISTLAFVCIVR